MTRDLRSEALAEARTWLATPYRHQASVKGWGCDCLGLVRGVWRQLYGAEPESVPPYRPDWAEVGAAETLRGAGWSSSRSKRPVPAMCSCSAWRPARRSSTAPS